MITRKGLSRTSGGFILQESHPGLERKADDSQPAQKPLIRLNSFGNRGVRIDGTEFPVELSVSRTEVGGRRFYTVIVRDITERKLAEEAMRRRLELQQQLAMIAESVPGVICSFRLRPDGSACMPFAMPAIEDLYGIPAGVLAEDFSPVYSNVHPDGIRDMRARERCVQTLRFLALQVPLSAPGKGRALDRGVVPCAGGARWKRSLAWILDGRHRPRASKGGEARI
jgi:PAS domain-containing protein